MKIALIGATGQAGSRILAELLRRGHTVTAIARNPGRVAPGPRVTARAGDISQATELAPLLSGHDAVVSAVRFLDTDARALVETVRASGVRRYVVVGGAASLEVSPGRRLFDSPHFPAAYKAEAGAGIAFLDLLRSEADLEWTFVSPSAMFVAGERTGRFRLERDALLANEAGVSSISFEDYAVALVDELERPAHVRQRFTVGY
jgi:uncharacterized protein